tara:strand:+ start:10201 stop:11187 length:987 start_codon:yes stop_codon:yes gene_type:complete
MESIKTTPKWVWILLIGAVFGVSSAGALFQQVDEVPPLLRASWRLQLTTLVLAPFALIQWRNTDTEVKSQIFQRNTILWLIGGGLALALHFGSWVASLDKTSLTHSLLFVTAHPLIIIVGMLIIARFMVGQRKPSKKEIIGACIGFLGAIIALFDQGHQQGDHTVTLWGDFLAFMGAVFVVGYLVSGRVLRKWMPIFIYAFIVTLIGAIILIPASWAMESEFSKYGVFGWTEGEFFLWFLALALIAGVLGHTGLNTCLRYTSPLVISTSVTVEPILGSIIGFVIFDEGLPGFWTWIGGPILVVGILLVVMGAPQSNTNNEALEAVAES